jgi:hypothetical protein
MLLKQEAAQPDRPGGENLKRDWLVHAVASDRLVTNWSWLLPDHEEFGLTNPLSEPCMTPRIATEIGCFLEQLDKSKS